MRRLLFLAILLVSLLTLPASAATPNVVLLASVDRADPGTSYTYVLSWIPPASGVTTVLTATLPITVSIDSVDWTEGAPATCGQGPAVVTCTATMDEDAPLTVTIGVTVDPQVCGVRNQVLKASPEASWSSGTITNTESLVLMKTQECVVTTPPPEVWRLWLPYVQRGT